MFGGLAGVTALLVARQHEPLRLLAIDPEIADVVGLRSRAWHAALAIWLGLAVGLSIRVSGTLYTFGCLVLPALVAKHLVREVRALIWVAPAIAVAAAVRRLRVRELLGHAARAHDRGAAVWRTRCGLAARALER